MLTCKFCDKEFEPYHEGNGKGRTKYKYCSAECANLGDRAARRAKRAADRAAGIGPVYYKTEPKPVRWEDSY